MAASVLVVGLTPLVTGQRRAPVGDHAGIELYTREALALRQRVGSYSRFAFHHPGPAFFYLAAPLYRASGERYAGIEASSALLAAAALVAMLAWAGLGGGAAGVWAAALALALAIATRGAGAWASPWNPNVAAAAFGGCLFGLARVAAGGGSALPWAVAFGSLAVQSHLGCAPVVAGLGLLAVAVALRRGGVGRRTWAASALVAVVFWALPVADGFGPGHGNLGDLWAFASDAHEGHGLIEAATAVAKAFAFGVPGAAGLLAAAAAAAAIAAGRRGALMPAWLARFALVGVVLATLAATRAAGPLYGYLLRWVGLLGVGALAAVTHMLLLAAGERWRPVGNVRMWLHAAALAWLAALGLVAAWRGLTAAEDRIEGESEPVLRIADALTARLKEHGIRWPLFVVTDPTSRPVALGVLLELDKRGVDFGVKPFNVIRFPPAWQTARQDATVAFGRQPGAGEMLVREGAYRVVLLSEPAVTRP